MNCLLLTPLLNKTVGDDLMGRPHRSLSRALDRRVASTDKHTVKPWFAGHAEFPPSLRLRGRGLSAHGGRADTRATRSAVLSSTAQARMSSRIQLVANNRYLP